MPTSTNGNHSFRIEITGAVAAAIRQLQRQASREGRGHEFLLAFRRVVERLRRNPTELGEPLYRLIALRMQLRCVVIRPVYVDFAVCEDRPLVFIKAVKLLSLGGS